MGLLDAVGGPGTSGVSNLIANMEVSPVDPGINATSTNLPLATSVPIGTMVYTTDLNWMYSNGVTWIKFSDVVSGSSPVFSNSVSAVPAASQNNYAPSGYVAGTTNLLLLTPAANATITGLLAAPMGWTLYMNNASATYTITLSNLSGSSLSANQFSCPTGTALALPPQTGAILIYTGSQWSFA